MGRARQGVQVTIAEQFGMASASKPSERGGRAATSGETVGAEGFAFPLPNRFERSESGVAQVREPSQMALPIMNLKPVILDAYGEGARPAERSDREKTAKQLEVLAHVMDNAFEVPGVGLRFGFDAILGLIPGVGDAGTSLVSAYVIHQAHRLGVGRATLARMAANVALDFVVGAVPFAGDLFDLYWKANRRNVELLRKHAAAPPAEEGRMRRSDTWFVVMLLVGLFAVLGASIWAAFTLMAWVIGWLTGA